MITLYINFSRQELYIYRSTPEILRFHPIPPFIFLYSPFNNAEYRRFFILKSVEYYWIRPVPLNIFSWNTKFCMFLLNYWNWEIISEKHIHTITLNIHSQYQTEMLDNIRFIFQNFISGLVYYSICVIMVYKAYSILLAMLN